jgi:hypothetical protein
MALKQVEDRPVGDKFVSFVGHTITDVNNAFAEWVNEAPRHIKSFSREFFPALARDTGYPRPSGNPGGMHTNPGAHAPQYVIDVIYRDI